MMEREETERRPDPPFVSFIVPTLNSQRVLGACLESIAGQDYPRDRLEVVVADGGSRDATISIVQSFDGRIPVRVVENNLRIGEAGKSAGVRVAAGEILAFVDSDNVLPGPEWLARMVAPFGDPEIVATEPIEFTYRREDNYLTRYAALLGMNDPLCLFLGNYDRMCAVTGLWTETPLLADEDKGDWRRVTLDHRRLPTIGANGFLIRRDVLAGAFGGAIPDYLFDIDVLGMLGETRPLIVAKVKTGIIHLQAGSLGTFIRKQRRRIRDYQYFSRRGERRYDWRIFPAWRLAWFVFACVSVVPLLVQAGRGFRRRPDAAWLFHPLASLVTLWVYGVETIKGLVRTPAIRRRGWSQ
jgi:glycosyltransferase involved in cell wall biosynthesis